MTEFDGLVAVVTGGASGLGAATAALFAERGATVAILDRDVSAVDPMAFTAVVCDITSAAAVDTAIALVVEKLGGIDIVVNNAGIGATGEIIRNFPDAKIVIVTDYGSADLRRAAQDAGAHEYIVKENLIELRRLLAH